MNRFDDAFERLSKLGACDSPGGAEYARVAREYDDAGRPSDVDAFIWKRANATKREIGDAIGDMHITDLTPEVAECRGLYVEMCKKIWDDACWRPTFQALVARGFDEEELYRHVMLATLHSWAKRTGRTLDEFDPDGTIHRWSQEWMAEQDAKAANEQGGAS